MTLELEEKNALIAYRLQKAYKSLKEAQDNAGLGHWTLAANRLYYSVYYAATALLINQNIETHTHSGMIRLIGMRFVNEGVLTKEEGRLLSRLFDMRQTGDYDDFFEWTEEDVEPFFDKALSLIQKIEELIKTM